MRYYNYGQERGNVSVCGVLKVLILKNGRTITADLVVVNLFLNMILDQPRNCCVLRTQIGTRERGRERRGDSH